MGKTGGGAPQDALHDGIEGCMLQYGGLLYMPLQDVGIVVAFILGLINSHGLDAPYQPQQQAPPAGPAGPGAAGQGAGTGTGAGGAAQGAGAGRADQAGGQAVGSSTGAPPAQMQTQTQQPSQQQPAVVASLQPFLFHHASHFWHELRSFAASRLNVTVSAPRPSPSLP